MRCSFGCRLALTFAVLAGCSPSTSDTVVDTDAGSALDVPRVDRGPAVLDRGPVVLDRAPATDIAADLALPVDARPPFDPGCTGVAIGDVDLLLEIDNSNSMRDNQAQLAAQFRQLLVPLVNPPPDPMTGRPRYPPVRNLHVGVISSDLGTPGNMVTGCSNTDQGDDGLLNPIRQGGSMRTHQPWTSVPPVDRPARCTNDPNQYPPFLTFDAASTSPDVFRDDFVCVALLSTGGCGLEQQLESAYRALVVHDARERDGNTDPNRGFLRDGAVLAIVLVTDEEDGSTRDCRYTEPGFPCSDAIDVFDSASGQWAAADLGSRHYLYEPGSPQDPTWNIDRYIDPRNRNRGFLGLKPNHPERVIFAAIAGVPNALPMRAGGVDIDWDTLLGREPNGSDGYVGTSPEGPVSMRQRNSDPMCPSGPNGGGRVVPACYREGSMADPRQPRCSTANQYFALPSRRVAQVVRRFDDAYRNGVLSSVCRADYASALSAIVTRIQARLCGPG